MIAPIVPVPENVVWWSGFDDEWEIALGEIISSGFAEVI